MLDASMSADVDGKKLTMQLHLWIRLLELCGITAIADSSLSISSRQRLGTLLDTSMFQPAPIADSEYTFDDSGVISLGNDVK